VKKIKNFACGNAIQFNDKNQVTFNGLQNINNEIMLDKMTQNLNDKNDDEEVKLDEVYLNDDDFKLSFKEKYENMDDVLKWKLSCTGRVVEDVIYESISRLDYEQ
jgi:hypothetical protein